MMEVADHRLIVQKKRLEAEERSLSPGYDGRLAIGGGVPVLRHAREIELHY